MIALCSTTHHGELQKSIEICSVGFLILVYSTKDVYLSVWLLAVYRFNPSFHELELVHTRLFVI